MLCALPASIHNRFSYHRWPGRMQYRLTKISRITEPERLRRKLRVTIAIRSQRPVTRSGWPLWRSVSGGLHPPHDEGASDSSSCYVTARKSRFLHGTSSKLISPDQLSCNYGNVQIRAPGGMAGFLEMITLPQHQESLGGNNPLLVERLAS